MIKAHTKGWARPLALLLVLNGLLLMAAGAHGTEPAHPVATVVGGSLHLRAAPSLDAEILLTEPDGAYVRILGEAGGFYQVRTAGGAEGFMDRQFLYVATPGVVESGEGYASLLQAPEPAADSLGEYASGTPLTLLWENAYGWAYVDIDGVQGYMPLAFIQPAGPGETPPPVRYPDAQIEANPYALLINQGGDDAHQIGTAQQDAGEEDALSWRAEYPQLNIAKADGAIRTWLDETLADARRLAQNAKGGDAVHVDIGYRSYLLDFGYASVLAYGTMDSSLLANPADLVLTVNANIDTGEVVTYRDMFFSSRLDGVLALLMEKLSAMSENPASGALPDESWLNYMLMVPGGVHILLPKGEYLASGWGTQSVTFSYEELLARNLLRLHILDTPPASGTAAP